MTRPTRSLLLRAGVAAAVVGFGGSLATVASGTPEASFAADTTAARTAALDPTADVPVAAGTLATLSLVAQQQRDTQAAAAAAAAAAAQAAADAAAAAAAQAEAERAAAAEEADRALVRGATTPDGARAAAQAMLADYGWSGDQFSCLDKLWQRESRWTYTAKNPSSGAYGIPQSLPASKMASAGADYRTNPITQITWGLGYIQDIYGTPCGAWAKSQSVGWY